jgi:hypothetical protein
MSISEPPPDAAIELLSTVASVELSVVASDFTPVAVGVGRLSAAVPAGIYQIVARAGPVVDRRLITLAPGATYRDDRISVRFPAPAPVSDTTTSHEYHQAAVEEASGRLSQAAGAPSGLVIVVRDVRGTSGPPLEPGDLACFGLLDQMLNPLSGFDQGWQLRPAEAVATWHGRLDPGGYALRTDPTLLTGAHRASVSRQPFDQSLWLSANWQTIVFITTGEGGPQTTAASVHMAQLGIGWSPYDTDVGLALELANWGLREGRSVLPNDLLNLLLNTKFVNPMLGIVGAHSLLLRSEVDWDVVETVLHNLELMVPGHPDVVALRWRAARRRSGEGTPGPNGAAVPSVALGGAAWPPTLLASYRALLEMDAIDASAIADGSPAELAASNLLVQGIWTSWAPVEFEPPPPPPPPPAPGAPLAPPAPTAEAVLAGIAGDPSLVDRVRVDDRATARVVGYLTGLGTLEGSRRSARFAALTPQEIALATTLPVATVERSLTKIGTALGPPTPPPPPRPIPGNGGGGIPVAVLATLAAGALLLIGAVGATAWCASNESCPIQIGPVESNAQPTEPPVTSRPAISEAPTRRPVRRTPAPPTPSPAPIVLDYLNPVAFGPITVGSAPATVELRIRGSDDAPLAFTVLENPDSAFAAEPTCEWLQSSEGGLECAILVTFEPRAVMPYAGSLEMRVGEEPNPRRIDLVGEGIAVILLEVPGELPTFPDTVVNTTSELPLVFTATDQVRFTFSIDQPESFGVLGDCAWTELGPQQHECTVPVAFSPDFAGLQDGRLSILLPGTNVASNPIFLSGTGISDDSPD